MSPVEEAVYIDEQDPLPLFAFIYNGWIAGDAGNEGYTVLREDGAAYDASSSTSAGTYAVTPVPLNDNYSYTLESGILYVNPAGPGTRAVKPILNCIEKISKNGEPDLYVANFTYENRNSVTVHIPLGPDNLFTGSGIDWENAPPEIPTAFLPEGGSFQVFFDGSELSWSVASRDQDQKVRNAANANSSSTKCKGNSNAKKAAAEVSVIEEDVPGAAVLKAFPNPVVNMVTIELAGIEGYQMVQIFDLAGKSHPVTPLVTRSDRLEIDMTRLSSGQYVIRIILEDRSEIVHIIKQ